MFDVSGTVEASPVEGITVNGGEVSPGQKAEWERELLGVLLSESPLKAVALGSEAGAITSSDQLNAEMEGQTVSILGQLSAVSERVTRAQRPYVVATLELVSGSTEVVAWPDVLERTRDIWRGGNLLLVSGRLRVKDDELSVHCDKVEVYSEAEAPESNASVPAPANSVDTVRPPEERPDAEPTGRPLTLVLTLVESESGEDTHLLREAVGILLEYPGSDRVHVEITTGGKRVLLDLPMITTGYCPELQRRLDDLLGAGSLRVENQGIENRG